MAARTHAKHIDVVDPNNSRRRFENWKKKNTKGLFPQDVKLIEEYLDDMLNGINVSKTKRGQRSYSRLSALTHKIPKVAHWIKDRYNKRIIEVTNRECHLLFNDLRNGVIKTRQGKPYKSHDDYAKDFLAFWNWYIRKLRREYNQMTKAQKAKVEKSDYFPENAMQDVDYSDGQKTSFHYFTEDQYKQLRDRAKHDYRVMMDFLYDTGMRAPSEMMNIKVSDITQDKDNPNVGFCEIRDEVTKTFGRKIKLMFCYSQLKEYIKNNKLKDNDYIFTKNPKVVNRYLKRLGFRVLKIGEKSFRKAGKHKTVPDVKDGLTLYDFRHNSACYWLPRYKSETGLKYRFGWKSSRMIEYYTEFLGMRDTIQQEDLLIDVTLTDIEKELEKERRQRELMEDRMQAQEKELKQRESDMLKNQLNMKKKLDQQEKKMELLMAILAKSGKKEVVDVLEKT
ncbi:tyrosine-type recombinase/integrase [Candidatus Woesearchaeota archaeon]|nr:tyrosine-type recombinase/integrase [Candidatus Woesearchaeota archaeon]